MRRILIILAALGTTSCGDPTDRPEDCTSNEFFDEARRLCLTCRAVPQPVCDEGCSFEIVPDPNTGCPSASCLSGDGCGRCSKDEYFDSATLTCTACEGPQTCDGGEEPEQLVVGGRCVLQCP